MNPELCSFAACTDPLFAAKLCRRHYQRQLRNGTPGCPTCRQRDVEPHQRQCLVCIAAEFRRLGHEPLEQAIQDFRAEGIIYVAGWTGGQHPVDARCAECGHIFRPSLKHVRAGHGCPRCNLTGVWTVARLQRDPVLAARPALLYLVEFTDWADIERQPSLRSTHSSCSPSDAPHSHFQPTRSPRRPACCS